MTNTDEPDEPAQDQAVPQELLDPANAARAVVEAWVGRIAATGGGGRSATTVARMATARAIADMRHIQAPESADSHAPAVADYIRRSRSMLTNAAHEIERNRYSLLLMQQQLDRLKPLFEQIWPEEAKAAKDAAESEGPAGGADDRGADGEIAPGQ
jgi:ribosomal protein S9